MKNLSPNIRTLFIVMLVITPIAIMMFLEANQLLIKYKQLGQLITYIAIVIFSIASSVMLSSYLFYRNRKNPKMTMSKAKFTYAITTTFVSAAAYILLSFTVKGSTACLKPTIEAIVTDPNNLHRCLNIKSVLITKFLPFAQPIFIGQIFVSALVVITISVLTYALVTSKFLYKADR